MGEGRDYQADGEWIRFGFDTPRTRDFLDRENEAVEERVRRRPWGASPETWNKILKELDSKK